MFKFEANFTCVKYNLTMRKLNFALLCKLLTSCINFNENHKFFYVTWRN